MDGRSRLERRYEHVVIALAVAAVVLHVRSWDGWWPDVGVVGVVALLLVPLAVRTQITISRGEPDLTLGASAAALFSTGLAPADTLLPLWALAVTLSYAVFWRDETWGVFRAGIQVLGGVALVAAGHAADDRGFEPYVEVFAGLAAYFATITALEVLRQLLVSRFVAQDEDGAPGGGILKLRWAFVLLVGTAIYYVGAIVAVLRQVEDGVRIPTDTTLVVLAVGAVAVCAGLGMRNRQLARSLDAVAGAAVTMPWPRDAIDGAVRQWGREALRTDDVRIEDEPGGLLEISAPFDGRHVVARRAPGDLPFTSVERDVVDALASMARASQRRAAVDDHLLRLSRIDQLSGVLTFAAFRDELDELGRDREPDERIAVVFIDFDDFKEINDTHGHLAGDVVIKTIAERLRQVVGTRGLVSRFGGDEFALALRDVGDADALERFLERLTARISEPVVMLSRTVVPQVSVGSAVSTRRGDDMEEVVRAADRAMYERKLGTRAGEDYEAAVTGAVRRAIRERRVVAFLQPIVDVEVQLMQHWEVLVRYEDPRLGYIDPPTLVTIASRMQLLDELSDQLLDAAVETILAIRELVGPQQARRVRGFSINLEIDQVQSWSPLLERLSRLVEEHDMTVSVELSERSLDGWSALNDEIAERLRNAGVSLAMDDFGTGYAALGSLPVTPVDVVKVDRSMVPRLEDPRQAVLLRRVVEMLHELDFLIVVEGIEQPEDMAMVRSVGVRLAQGHLFGRAVSAEDMLDRVRAHGLAALVP